MPPDSDPSPTDVREWQQLHPLTPVLRSWRVVAPLTFAAVQVSADLGDRRWAVAILVASVLVGGGLGYASWRTTRYRVGPDSLEIRSGVLFRQRRRLPLARLESVDIKRSLVARALGLAELRAEAVSTGDAELALAYVSESEALALRATLLARRAGIRPEAEPPPEQGIAQVPVHALIVTGLAVPAVLLALSLGAAGVVAVFSPGAGGAVVLAFLPTIGILTAASVARQESLYGFTIADAPDGLRIRRGLLNLRTQTIPAGRVQAVRIEEPLLWRSWGWVRVYVDVAGYRGGRQSDRQDTSLLMPVAPRALVGPLLARVLPGVDLATQSLEPPPKRARWRAPLTYHWLGAAWTEGHAITRRGVVRRITDVVPHRKVQSLRITEGPLQRRLGLASVHLDTPGQTVRSIARHRSTADALDLVARSRAADVVAE